MSVDHPPPLPPPNLTKKHTSPASAPVTNRDDTSGLRGDKGRPKGPHGKREKRYINLNYLGGQLDAARLPLAAGSGIAYRPNYVNFPGVGMNSETEREGTCGSTVPHPPPQRGHVALEEVRIQPHQTPDTQKTSSSSASHHYNTLPPRQEAECTPRTEARSSTEHHYNYMYLLPHKDTECSQCGDLLECLSLWEIGVSGLTRQYSQILAQLHHARDAATSLEYRVKEGGRVLEGRGGGRDGGGGERQGEGSGEEGEGVVISPRRKTIAEESPIQSVNLADQMYPQPSCTDKEPSPQLPSEYEQHFSELTSHLERAIDLCQQLAASSFKTRTSNLMTVKMKNSFKKVRRQESMPVPLTSELRGGKSPTSPWRPLLLGSVAEEPVDSKRSETKRKRGVLTRTETEPALSVSPDAEETEGERRMRTLFKFPPHTSKTGVSRSKTERVPNKDNPSKSPIAGDIFNGGAEETRPPVQSHVMSAIAEEEEEVRKVSREGEGSPSYHVVGSSESDEGEDSVLSHASTFSDTDVKQVMTKIALLEDERLRLLETIDQMQTDNQSIRLSLHETLGDLENKDLQLTLAMQDLSIATDEIKRVAALRAKLDSMERERESTLDKLSHLEDESAAVKVSLIQLLQQKSATNKTLVLENWRLRQAVRQGDSLSRTNSKSGNTPDPALSVTMDDDLSNYVHKQGFLVKQGRRVKNWKRRLFVLDSNGLSYYKTEQPINKVPLSDIQKIQVSHNHLTLPHMFEVHTPDRVFLLSAPSEDEMQSWIGMLQTLKQYAGRTHAGEEPLQVHNGTTTTNAILHQVAMENGATVMGKDGRSITLPTTAGMSVEPQSDVGRATTETANTLVQTRLSTGEKSRETASGEGSGVRERGGSGGRERGGSGGRERGGRERGGSGRGGSGTTNGRPRSQAFVMTKGMSLDEAIPTSSRPKSVMITTNSRTSGMEQGHEEYAGTEDLSPNHARVLSRSHPSTRASELMTSPTAIFGT